MLNENFNTSKLFLYNRVWDNQDIVYPPTEKNGFFLTSNLVITKDQAMSTCPDLSSKDCDEANVPNECLDAQSVLSDGEIRL